MVFFYSLLHHHCSSRFSPLFWLAAPRAGSLSLPLCAPRPPALSKLPFAAKRFAREGAIARARGVIDHSLHDDEKGVAFLKEKAGQLDLIA